MFSVFAAPGDVLPRVPVTVSGQWTSRAQLRYATAAQQGSGEGPFERVVDWTWEGTCACAVPLAGLAFLANERDLYWVKSSPPEAAPTIRIWAGGQAEANPGVMFTGSFHGAHLPGFPTLASEPVSTATHMGAGTTTTGVAYAVATLGAVVLGVVLVPAPAVRVGRNRLWRLREELAVNLPPDLRRIMTERRTGHIQVRSGS